MPIFKIFYNGTIFEVGGGGTGDVVGPGSATDNAVTRFDGTTGKLVQDSTVLIADNGVMSIPGIGSGGFTAYDFIVGGAAYGMIQMGNASIGRTSYKVGAIDLDGAILIRNIGGPVTGKIEIIFVESAGGDTRFAIPVSGVGYATYNPRSMLIIGPAPADTDMVDVVYWQALGWFHNLVCDTSGSGADLGVQNDLEVEGIIYIDDIVESTTAAGVTIEAVLIKDGLVDARDVAADGADLDDIVGASFVTLAANATLTGERILSALQGLLLTESAPNLFLSLDINALTADATPDGAADYVVTYDAGAATHKKVLLNDLPGGGGGDTHRAPLFQVLTPEDGETYSLRFAAAVTITEITHITDVGTVDFNFEIRGDTTPFTTGTKVWTGGDKTANTTHSKETSFDNAAVAADRYLTLTFASPSSMGTAVITVEYTVD